MNLLGAVQLIVQLSSRALHLPDLVRESLHRLVFDEFAVWSVFPSFQTSFCQLLRWLFVSHSALQLMDFPTESTHIFF